MSTSTPTSRLGDALFGATRMGVITLLWANADRSYHVREIARRAGTGLGAVQRELASLYEADLISRSQIGNQVHYRANQASPIFEELRGLVLKTTGLADPIAKALAPFVDRISTAYVYGSVARGTEHSDSDIDLMVVGAVTLHDLVPALAEAQGAVGREINPTVFSVEEYTQRLAGDDPFLRAVADGPQIHVLGDAQGV